MGLLQAPVTQLPESLYLLQVETAVGILHQQRVLKQRSSNVVKEQTNEEG
ncbi:hypothetical protein [Nibrella saemangeumensis]